MDLAQALAARAQRGVRQPTTTLLGWVVSWTSATVTVNLGEETVTVPNIRGYSPTADDVVIILKTGRQMYAIGALNAAPTSPTPPDDTIPLPPSPVSDVRTRTFRPLSVGTYRSGWRKDSNDALQGDWGGFGLNYGAAYYGAGPSGLSGTAVSGTVRIKRESGGVFAPQTPTFRLLTHKNRPAGSPTSSDTFVGPGIAIGASRTVTLPDAWVQELIDGTAGGIGIGIGSSSPYIRLSGRGSWSPSFELTLKWKD